jgi:hypothetical protein
LGKWSKSRRPRPIVEVRSAARLAAAARATRNPRAAAGVATCRAWTTRARRCCGYTQRWQVNKVNSIIKRDLGFGLQQCYLIASSNP